MGGSNNMSKTCMMLMCLASIAAISYSVPTPYTSADELIQEEMAIPSSEEKIIDAYAADRVKYDAAHAAQESLDAEEQAEPAEATEVDDEDDNAPEKPKKSTTHRKGQLEPKLHHTPKRQATMIHNETMSKKKMKAARTNKVAMKPNATKKEAWGDEAGEFEEDADDEDEDEDADEEELAEEEEEFKPKNATKKKMMAPSTAAKKKMMIAKEMATKDMMKAGPEMATKKTLHYEMISKKKMKAARAHKVAMKANATKKETWSNEAGEFEEDADDEDEDEEADEEELVEEDEELKPFRLVKMEPHREAHIKKYIKKNHTALHIKKNAKKPAVKKLW